MTTPLIPPSEGPAEAAGFDFLIGDWKVLHRQLKRRLAGSTEWTEFPGTLSVAKILGGLGNIDENVLDKPDGRYWGTSLRLFNPATGDWSIYWMDSRSPSLDTPVVGRFADGKGVFTSDETFEGKPIKLRFTYTPVSAGEARWEQAFSPDNGGSWETNWTMRFTR